MADMTESHPQRDMVTCACGRRWDRNVYSICTDCLSDLWQLDSAPPPPTGTSGPTTVLEDGTSATEAIDFLVNGHRLTLQAGDTLALGRADDSATEPVFRESRNVSRLHAQVRFDGERVFVTDKSSSNGTFVSEQRLPAETEYELKPGQSLRLASNVAVQIEWGK